MENLTFQEMSKILFSASIPLIAISEFGSVAIARFNNRDRYLILDGELRVTQAMTESKWDIIEPRKPLG